jgi:5-methylcytosine-specific restriction endonuclease McrA
VSDVYAPIAKPSRLVSAAAIEAARLPWCECCIDYAGPFQVHHVRSRGAGGHDEAGNLVNLCFRCHDRVHRGLVTLDQLWELVGRSRS